MKRVVFPSLEIANPIPEISLLDAVKDSSGYYFGVLGDEKGSRELKRILAEQKEKNQ